MSCNSAFRRCSRNYSFKFLAVTLLSIFLLSACGGSDYDPPESNDEAAGSWQENACKMAVPEGLTEEDFTCGTFTVPNDWDFPQGETISFEVAVLKARNTPSKADPFVFIGGGPGAWNLEGYLPIWANGVLRPINTERDIVFFDQRGNGLSSPSLFCPEVYEKISQYFGIIQDAVADAETQLLGVQDCHTRLIGNDIDLATFNSYQIASDVESLMEALAYGTYNLYGISYGGNRVQVIMREHPEDIRSVILDSPGMPEIPPVVDLGASFERSLDLLFDACAESSTCANANPDLKSTLIDVVARLNAEPHYSPLTQADGGTQDVYITGERFLAGLNNVMNNSKLIPLVPTVITSTAAGEMGLLDAFVPQLLSTSGTDHGLYVSTNCAERAPFVVPEAVDLARQELNPFLGLPRVDFNARYFSGMCEIWQIIARPAIEAESVVSDIPSLILSGNFDPVTPPSNGEKANKNLANSQYFLFNGIGHGVLRSDTGEGGELSCAARIVTEFLDEPTSVVDGACAAGLPGPFE